MSGILTDFQRNVLGGDIIEDRGDVIYVGIFGKGGDETGKDNCIIKRITMTSVRICGNPTERDTVGDWTCDYWHSDIQFPVVRTQYPDGNNYDFCHTWADREKYDYKYARAK